MKIKVGHHDIKVKRMAQADRKAAKLMGYYVSPDALAAEHEAERGTIHISPRVTDAKAEAAVLLHEVLHAAWDFMALPGGCEERCVRALETAIVMLMKDNPWLFPAIQAGVNQGAKIKL